jgi:hypothetical protein
MSAPVILRCIAVLLIVYGTASVVGLVADVRVDDSCSLDD